MKALKTVLLAVGALWLLLGVSLASGRAPRTLSSLFSSRSKSHGATPKSDDSDGRNALKQQQPHPLVYQVKYYDNVQQVQPQNAPVVEGYYPPGVVPQVPYYYPLSNHQQQYYYYYPPTQTLNPVYLPCPLSDLHQTQSANYVVQPQLQTSSVQKPVVEKETKQPVTPTQQQQQQQQNVVYREFLYHPLADYPTVIPQPVYYYYNPTHQQQQQQQQQQQIPYGYSGYSPVGYYFHHQQQQVGKIPLVGKNPATVASVDNNGKVVVGGSKSVVMVDKQQ